MKYLIVILIFFNFADNYTKFKVLDKFILGESTIEAVSSFVDTSNIITVYDNDIRIDSLEYDKFIYQNERVKIKLIFINNKLFSIRYFPPNKEYLLNYEKYLNKKLSVSFAHKIWFHGKFDLMKTKNTVLVEYDLLENFVSTYIHYDFGMALKYKKYKNTY